jgi:hypothetical protein
MCAITTPTLNIPSDMTDISLESFTFQSGIRGCLPDIHNTLQNEGERENCFNNQSYVVAHITPRSPLNQIDLSHVGELTNVCDCRFPRPDFVGISPPFFIFTEYIETVTGRHRYLHRTPPFFNNNGLPPAIFFSSCSMGGNIGCIPIDFYSRPLHLFSRRWYAKNN